MEDNNKTKAENNNKTKESYKMHYYLRKWKISTERMNNAVMITNWKDNDFYYFVIKNDDLKKYYDKQTNTTKYFLVFNNQKTYLKDTEICCINDFFVICINKYLINVLKNQRYINLLQILQNNQLMPLTDYLVQERANNSNFNLYTEVYNDTLHNNEFYKKQVLELNAKLKINQKQAQKTPYYPNNNYNANSNNLNALNQIQKTNPFNQQNAILSYKQVSSSPANSTNSTNNLKFDTTIPKTNNNTNQQVKLSSDKYTPSPYEKRIKAFLAFDEEQYYLDNYQNVDDEEKQRELNNELKGKTLTKAINLLEDEDNLTTITITHK